MPYTSPAFGITVPCVTEAVNPSNFELLARGTEAAISTVDASATTALLRPAVLLRNTAGTPFTVGVPVVVSFNTEDVDTNGMWTAAAPTIVTINTAGTYLVTVVCSTNLSNNTSHKCEILLNGNPISSFKSGPGFAGTSPPTPIPVEILQRFAVADQITVRVTITGTDNFSTFPQLAAVLVSYGV